MESNTKKLSRASLLLAMGIVFQIIGRNIPQINQFLELLIKRKII